MYLRGKRGKDYLFLISSEALLLRNQMTFQILHQKYKELLKEKNNDKYPKSIKNIYDLVFFKYLCTVQRLQINPN